MFLAPDVDERGIADAAAAFLRNEFPLERLHATPRDPVLLQPFAELGWLGLSAPEELGGSGLGIVEEMLFFLELGRVAGPVGVLAQLLAVAAAREDAALGARLVAGKDSVALLVEQAPGSGIRLIGDAGAGYALSVDSRGSSLYEFDGTVCRDVPCLDRSVGMLVGDDAALRPLLRREGDEVWTKAQIAVSAMLTGVAERAMEMIVAYAKQRHTFGRPIGAYQAVRHPCADMAVRVECARSQLYYATAAIREGHADARMQTDAAALLAERAARANTDANIQLHGGIGVTDEHSAHLLLKRANLLARLFGGGRRNLASLLRGPGEAANAGEQAWT